eukprot:CAMPEP_0168590354 /NCGR_PEP_ID=MMETSP0420-20121227/6523_1 /TAXON_ID=498008 /ORGANISM="Pessonella sp." /LENGTH=196 /DNA_ID=CAMNT_0008626007 /DNA_START=24 /DNA_END=611 /DNA_ORIENTATION=+
MSFKQTPSIPSLTTRGAIKALEFYEKAFDAKVTMKMPADHDPTKLMHSEMTIGGGKFFVSDEFPEFGSKSTCSPSAIDNRATTTIMLEAVSPEDVDKIVEKAVAAGAKETMPVDDQFWGDRMGMLQDPFGHVWGITSPISEERTKAAAAKWDEAKKELKKRPAEDDANVDAKKELKKRPAEDDANVDAKKELKKRP